MRGNANNFDGLRLFAAIVVLLAHMESLSVILPLALMSWHYVERPAIRRKPASVPHASLEPVTD